MIGQNWVVLPTYNEAANIEAILRRVTAVFSGSILVVDDNSPDGTGQLVETLAKQHWPNLEVLHRPAKQGLAAAYREGLGYVLSRGAEQVVHMDADGSHDPKLIPEMLKALQQSDLALASRYIPGGKFPIAWYRRWMSVCGNLYIRALLGWNIHDWSTGYKAWRADLLRRVLSQPTTTTGYAWLMETTWTALKLGGRVVELPLQFQDRQAGESKFSWRIAQEDIQTAWRLRRRTLAPDQKM